MSMRKRPESQQQEMWVPAHTLPETPRGFHGLVPVVAAWADRAQKCLGTCGSKMVGFAALEVFFSSPLLSKGRNLRLSIFPAKDHDTLCTSD